MILRDIKILANKNYVGDFIDLYIAHVDDDRTRSVATNITFENMTEGAIYEPTLHIGLMEAQALMDSLWSCGLRPTEGKGSAGQLSATEAHLKDMQRIAFKFLEAT